MCKTCHLHVDKVSIGMPFYNHIPNIRSVKAYPIAQRKEAVIYSYIFL